ncbi:MAG: PEP/pyruvate-binding domain-containing protein [Chloroflexi bacterium]|nr:PEP/pyruvate-binding domain-containing protein [Chloroflexota bacterium]
MPASTSPYVEWLGRAEGGVAALGGKGASLDRLIRLGFRVPPGFCLTTTAFDTQVDGLPGARSAIQRLPDEASREWLEAALREVPLQSEVVQSLAAALLEISASPGDAGGSTFAVRSSGVGEDGADASYAGLHETELGVVPEDVAGAVRRCWASQWSAPALFYRRRRGFAPGGGAMAVVVQRLVPASAAAVAFTRHPVTGREDQIVITAVRGLGDAMVSGTVTPDTIVVDRVSLSVVEHTVADQAAGPALHEAQIRDLAEQALRIEAAYGAAVDVEAAIGDDAWFLLQARPITTR